LPRVIDLTGRDAAARARSVLSSLGPGTVIVAEYHDWQYLLYLKLVEGRAPAGPYVADESVGLGEVVAYLRDRQPMSLRQLGVKLPPGLDLYSDKLFAPKRYEQAGLAIEPWPPDLYRIRYGAPADK